MRAVRLALVASVAVVATLGVAAPAQADPLECNLRNPVVCYVECMAAKNGDDIKRGDLDCPVQ